MRLLDRPEIFCGSTPMCCVSSGRIWDRSIRKWLGRLGPEAFFQLLEVKRTDGKGQAYELVKGRLAELEKMKAKAAEIIAQDQRFTLKDLAVNDRDVIAAGIAPGPEVGQMLNGLLGSVVNGDIQNERDKLLQLLEIESTSDRYRYGRKY